MSSPKCPYLRFTVGDLERLADARLAQVPVVEWIEALQQLDQLGHIHVVVVVEMAEPLFVARQKAIEFDAHLAAQCFPVVGTKTRRDKGDECYYYYCHWTLLQKTITPLNHHRQPSPPDCAHTK